MTSHKIVVSGNSKYGLAQSLKVKFPDAVFFSRSESNSNFTSSAELKKFAELSLIYNTYISCSCLYNFNQTLLLEAVAKCWLKNGHRGQIIVIGSSADSPVKGTDWLYPIEKKSLKAYCRNLSLMTLGGHDSKPCGFRITYLSPGYLNTPKANEKYPDIKKLDTDYIADLIHWLLEQPINININEISLDPIQES